MRHCSKPGCNKAAVSTLTYDYSNSTAVLGPLATTAEPHSYDLCEMHTEKMTVPKGWDVVRLQINYDQVPQSDDDLMALVEAVRDAAAGSPSSQGDSVGFSPFVEETDSTSPGLSGQYKSNLEVIEGEFGGTNNDQDAPSKRGSEPASPEHGPF